MKLLVVTSRFPYPLDKGDKLRIFNQIKELSKTHEIHLIALSFIRISSNDFQHVEKYCTSIKVFKINPFRQFLNLVRSVFSPLPFQVGIFYVPKIKREVHTIINKTRPNAIYCHLIRVAEYVKEIESIPKTLDYMDVFSKGIERRSLSSKFLIKPILIWEYKKLLHYENTIFDFFNSHTIISEQDKSFIPHHSKNSISVIENGVDKQVFFPVQRNKKFDLLFNGNMSYPPNIEAAIFAATKILPIVQASFPSVSLLIAGINPTQQIRRLKSNNVYIIDNFEDISEAFALSKINLAPMFSSIGLQNKIIQAMAMKIPTICSTLANNAVKATIEEEILVANNPLEYARYINKLLTDAAFYSKIAEGGFEFMQYHFDWENSSKKLEAILFQ